MKKKKKKGCMGSLKKRRGSHERKINKGRKMEAKERNKQTNIGSD